MMNLKDYIGESTSHDTKWMLEGTTQKTTQGKIIFVASSNPYVTQSDIARTIGISLVHINKT